MLAVVQPGRNVARDHPYDRVSMHLRSRIDHRGRLSRTDERGRRTSVHPQQKPTVRSDIEASDAEMASSRDTHPRRVCNAEWAGGGRANHSIWSFSVANHPVFTSAVKVCYNTDPPHVDGLTNAKGVCPSFRYMGFVPKDRPERQRGQSSTLSTLDHQPLINSRAETSDFLLTETTQYSSRLVI